MKKLGPKSFSTFFIIDIFLWFHSCFIANLGQGASGVVYSAIDKRDGRKVALKIAPANELAELTNEIGLQSISKHPNIVEYIEAYSFEVKTNCLSKVPTQIFILFFFQIIQEK